MTANTKNSKIAVAGGINSNTITKYTALNPDIMIVGGALTGAKDPVEEAKKIRAAIGGK